MPKSLRSSRYRHQTDPSTAHVLKLAPKNENTPLRFCDVCHVVVIANA